HDEIIVAIQEHFGQHDLFNHLHGLIWEVQCSAFYFGEVTKTPLIARHKSIVSPAQNNSEGHIVRLSETPILQKTNYTKEFVECQLNKITELQDKIEELEDSISPFLEK